MPKPEKLDSKEALADRVRDLFAKGALYRKFVYEGDNLDDVHPTAVNRGLRVLYLPSLKMYCASKFCKHVTNWVPKDNQVFYSAHVQSGTYVCRNCGNNEITYWYIWLKEASEHSITKVAQWPPLSIEIPAELAKALGDEDAQLYKKALTNFNFGYGLGAVAYFRRVLENKVNLLLDLIAEAARSAHFAEAELKRAKEIKESHRVEEKITFACKILPSHLKPGGHNPLDKLYAMASAGLHGESDDQCLTLFEEGRFVFEYLFKNLSVSNEEAREYVKRLSKSFGPKSAPTKDVASTGEEETQS